MPIFFVLTAQMIHLVYFRQRDPLDGPVISGLPAPSPAQRGGSGMGVLAHTVPDGPLPLGPRG